MSKAVICPVCAGGGKISPNTGTTTNVPEVETCHGCGGKGWIEIGDSPCYQPPAYPWVEAGYPTLYYSSFSPGTVIRF